MSTETMPKKRSNTSWYIAAAVIIIIIIVGGVVAYEYTRPSSPSSSPSPSASASASVSPSSSPATTTLNIYAGEVSSSTYGFGTSASSITSPGPTLTFTAGEKVTVDFHNVGTMAHNWAIVATQSSTAAVLWGAEIQSGSNPVLPGDTASVTFTVGSAGNYYYICQVDAHVALGMWGNVVVNP
jgi:plastocyanin